MRRTVRTAVLSLALTFGLLGPQASFSTPGDADEAPNQAQRELAEELGYEPDDPALGAAVAEAGLAQGAMMAAASADEAEDRFAQESETGQWIVVLEDPALATYDGGISGLAATSTAATGEDRLDVDTAASRAYVDHLKSEQTQALAEMAEELGHEVEVTQAYHYAINGLAIRATAEEAAALDQLPGVAWVEPEQLWELETDVSNDLIGSPAIWGGDTGSGMDTRGEGVITGMIDSGVNPDHPSFAATDGEGYTHTNPLGPGNYLGICEPGAPGYQDVCNDKLIGVYNFVGGSPLDTDGHGSHVGSTMAGNVHDAVFTVGDTEFARTISGVAPRANVISYKVCAPTCPGTATISAVNAAIANGTDVLNYSISGPDNPWNNAVDLAFLNGFQAGIYIAASAGNTGPGVGTVSKTAPWNATVAATNSPRLIAQSLSVLGPEPVPAELEQLSAVPGNGPGVSDPIQAPLKEDPENVRGCTAFPAGTFSGHLALIERGDCTFTIKVDNAAAAGALGVVMVNHMPGPPVVMGGLETTTIPAVMVSYEQGQPLRQFVGEHGTADVLLDSSAALTVTDAWSKMVADFSGRGPSQFDLLNPTFAAPGRNILAATAPIGGDPVQYEFMQGTSMSSPHGAGAGALLRGLHPDWSPAMIRSALASTADNTGMLKDDGVTPADAFDVGSGLVDLGAAGRVGIVMDETAANFRAANPASGGDPRTLNLPSFADHGCADVCSYERTVTSVSDATVAYSVATTADPGMTIAVEPSTFTLAPGATQVLTVTVDVSGDTTGAWRMGQVDVTTDGTHAGGTAVADVHYPVTVLAANPVMSVTPTTISSTLGVDEESTHTVTVNNSGTADLTWQISQQGECALPEWVTVDPTSGAVPRGGSETATVTLSSDDMAGGTYEATLCIAGNDPATPVVQVAITLEVVEIPVVDVDPLEVSTTLPADSTATETVSITNTGYGQLEWTLTDPDAGPSAERVEMLRNGVLVTPQSTRAPRQVLAFDPHDGALLDDALIPTLGERGTPHSVLALPDESGFIVSDQGTHTINKFDLDGNYLGIFAPQGGVDWSVLQNMRGMNWSPDGTLVVAVANGGNANSLAEFSADGEYLGQYVQAELDGLDGPWFPLFRDEELLVSASNSRAIHSFTPDGSAANPRFSTEISWPVQLAETATDSILAIAWTTRAGYQPSGVHEFSADGEHLWHGTIAGATNYSGVHALGNGNMLVTTQQGVYELARDGSSEQKWAGDGRTRMIHEISMPDLQECQTPDEVAWLDVDPDSGVNARHESAEVELTFDADGLVDGDYSARLCVSSNDPHRPYVPLDVSMTVTRPVCDTTVTGVRNGGLTVTDTVCVEPGARINGGVTVRPGGQLFVDSATITGGLRSSNADWVVVENSTISGSVTATLTSRQLVLDGNTVSGSMTVDRNRTGDQPIVVAANTIGRNLMCSGNEPPPTNDDRPNTVTGRKTGQCSDL